MKNFFRRILLFICCLVTFLLSAGNVDINTLAAKADSKNFPDADTVLLYDREEMIYQVDGTAEYTDEFYYKILNEAGKKSLCSIPLHNNSNYGTAVFTAASILRGGKKIDIDIPQNSTTTTETGQMGSNIYEPEQKVTTLAVPGLEIGDVLYIKTHRKTLKSIIPGEWSTIVGLESDCPILHYEVVINAPEKLPLLHTVIKNEVKGTVKSFAPEKKDGRIIYKWQAKNVPQAIPEPEMPELYTCCQRLLVGTAKDWHSISRWYYNLCRPRLDAVSDAMKQKVAELVKGAKSDEEKINRIFKFVSQEIRYTGITSEKDRPGFEPHDVRDTFAQKHGVCRDKAALLVSMLEMAGFKAFPVIFMAGRAKDSDVPNGSFNHAVACIDRGNFDYLMMDPTDENTRTLFPEYLSNQSFLVARSEGDILRRTPVIPAEKNSMDISTTARFTPGGKLEGNSTLNFAGISDLIYRSSFARMTPAKRLEFWNGRVRRVLPGAEVTSLQITPENIRDTSQPLVIKFSFKAAFPCADTDGAGVLAVPQFSHQFGVLNWLLPDISLESRRFPIETESTSLLKENIRLELPPQLKIAGMPKENGGKVGMFSWKRKFAEKDGALEINNLITLDNVEIKAEDYPVLRSELQRFASSEKELPVVRKDYSGFDAEKYRKLFPDADVVVLDSQTDVVLEEDNSSSVTQYFKVLMLTYDGVKRYSEIKEYFYPARESVDVEAVVTDKNGKTFKLAPEHIRIMDTSWAADLKHIPTEKIKICALSGVEEYSVIEYTVRRKSKKLWKPADGWQIQEHEPVLSWSMSIDAPEKLKLRTSALPSNVEFSRKNIRGRIVRSWKAKNISAVKNEYSQSPLVFFAPHISYSAATADGFAKKYNALLKAKADIKSTVAAKECFAGIDISSMKLEDKIIHIRNFIVRRVRVAGPMIIDEPPSCWRSPDEVYKAGVGTTAERAILFSVLLKEAGVKHRFHLAGDDIFTSASYKQYSHYFAPVFSAVLIYIPELNAWLNSESQYNALGYTPYQSCIGLNLENGRLSAINSSANTPNRLVREYKIKILSNKSAVIDITEKHSGSYFESANRTYSEMTPEYTRRHFVAKANAIDDSARLSGKYSTAVNGKQYIVKYSVIVPEFAKSTGEYLTFELPGHGVLRSLASVSGVERTTPYERGTQRQVDFSWKITAPKGYIHLSPDRVNSKVGNSQTAELIERRSAIRNELNISLKLIQPAVMIDASDFSRLIDIQNVLGKSRSRYCILKKEK